MSSRVHSTAIVDPAAQLGVDVEIGPFCIVGPQVRLGDRTRLVSHVVIEGSTVVGDDCVIYPFAMLGAPPQHLAHKGEETRLEIGDRNQIREHATMHAGTVQGGGVTRVGSDGLFMVGTHVAHDCVVGDRVAMANNAALGGHVKVGDFVFVGGLAGVHQHTRIGRYSFVGASAMVTKDVIPYGSVWGNHAHLEGLNLVGLKRRGFSRETINDLRSAYRLMFGPRAPSRSGWRTRPASTPIGPEVREIVDFVRADANRPLCLPTLEW
jgi:UDP-N-acetylglucosamine acyltransferase